MYVKLETVIDFHIRTKVLKCCTFLSQFSINDSAICINLSHKKKFPVRIILMYVIYKLMIFLKFFREFVHASKCLYEEYRKFL